MDSALAVRWLGVQRPLCAVVPPDKARVLLVRVPTSSETRRRRDDNVHGGRTSVAESDESADHENCECGDAEHEAPEDDLNSGDVNADSGCQEDDGGNTAQEP